MTIIAYLTQCQLFSLALSQDLLNYVTVVASNGEKQIQNVASKTGGNHLPQYVQRLIEHAYNVHNTESGHQCGTSWHYQMH